MISKVRTGLYGIYKKEQFEFIKKNKFLCRLIIRRFDIQKKYKTMGFKKYSESVYIMDIQCDSIDSAFSVTTYCNYESGKYFIEYISKEEVCLNPDLETLTEVLERHPYDHGRYRLEIPYKQFSEQVSEIWEERKKVPGFLFNAEKIKYLNDDLS